MSTEEKLRELVNYAIHHLSCGYTSNNERILALHHLQRGLHNIDAVEQPLAPDVAFQCANCGFLAINDKVCSGCNNPTRPAGKATVGRKPCKGKSHGIKISENTFPAR